MDNKYKIYMLNDDKCYGKYKVGKEKRGWGREGRDFITVNRNGTPEKIIFGPKTLRVKAPHRGNSMCKALRQA